MPVRDDRSRSYQRMMMMRSSLLAVSEIQHGGQFTFLLKVTEGADAMIILVDQTRHVIVLFGHFV